MTIEQADRLIQLVEVLLWGVWIQVFFTVYTDLCQNWLKRGFSERWRQ